MTYGYTYTRKLLDIVAFSKSAYEYYCYLLERVFHGKETQMLAHIHPVSRFLHA